MRGLFGVIGLLLTLAVVGLLVKKQAAPLAVVAPLPGQTQPVTAPDGQAPSAQAQSQALQAQVKQSLDAAMQTPRSLPDDK